MVCHLRGGTDLGVLRSKDAKQWLKSQSKPGFVSPPCEFLASAAELFERLSKQDKRFDKQVGSVIVITNEEEAAFSILNRDLRNQLEHFKPGGWLIDVKLIAQTLLIVLSILEKIRADQWAFRHLDQEDANLVDELLRDLRRNLEDQKSEACSN